MQSLVETVTVTRTRRIHAVLDGNRSDCISYKAYRRSPWWKPQWLYLVQGVSTQSLVVQCVYMQSLVEAPFKWRIRVNVHSCRAGQYTWKVPCLLVCRVVSVVKSSWTWLGGRWLGVGVWGGNNNYKSVSFNVFPVFSVCFFTSFCYDMFSCHYFIMFFVLFVCV